MEVIGSPTPSSPPTAILLISCPDQRGLVARTAQFVADHNGNLVHAEHHVDPSTGLFLMRLEWELAGFDLDRDEIRGSFTFLAEEMEARWALHFSDTIRRVAIFAGRQAHCLGDLLLRRRNGEIRMDVPLVISNHADLRSLTEAFGVEFHHIPVDPGGGRQHEQAQLGLLARHQVDLLVLAKYMQVLSSGFLERSPRAINIHHSFLPAFAGAQPYEQAFARGVKVIGASAHYVTAELDAGPIIEQDVVRVSHRDGVGDLIRKGRDLERVVLARAVRLHLNDRIMVHGNRTSVFE